jgi:hypothetical protein
MSAMLEGVKREADLVSLQGAPHGALKRCCARGQNFLIDWFEAQEAATIKFSGGAETMVLLFESGARVSGNGRSTKAPRRSLSVVPAGDYEILLQGAGRGCILSTDRRDALPAPLNAASYRSPDTRIAPVGTPWPRTGDPQRVQVFDIDKVQAPADNPRLKMFQSATMSVNWVDYDGPRDRSALSPHSHRDFEQASLAVEGDFVHHLRVEWGRNANAWRDDEHRLAGSPSVLVIPPDLIHTTEGVNAGHHLLIDIFAPPRRDFIAKNWVLNAAEYRDPLKI